MRINVLGPVELLDGTAEPPVVRGGRRRALLAALLLHAGRPVPRSMLVEAVWDGDPPSSVAANVRTYAADLRRLLGPAPDGRVRVVGDQRGYALDVRPGELDLLDFRRLAEAGREALHARDRDRAAAHLGEAVGLWRGRAFEGVELGSWAEAEVRALEERRWSVTTAWVDVRTALGRFDDLDVHLREMLAERPLAERAWARLMLVLERTGRTLEALAAFEEASAALRDGLGTGPGPELRAAHDRVRPAPSAPAPFPSPVVPSPERSVAPPRAVVCSLPTRPVVAGRDDAVADLRRALAAPDRPVGVALSGLAGSGKTAVALQVAAGLAERFPDGRLYLGLGGPRPECPAEALGTLLGSLGVRPADLPHGPSGRSHLFRLLLARRSVLVVLDDVADSAQVRPLLPGVGASRVLVVSRRRLTDLTGLAPRRLGPLPPEGSLQVLAALLGEERVHREPEQAERLARACGGMPGALRIVAARLAVRPEQSLGVLASRLADPAARLDEMVAGDCSVRDALAATCAGLSTDERRAALLLAAAGPRLLTAESVARLLRLPPARADRVIEGLICANVLVTAPVDPPRYRLDELVALHLREVAAAEARSPRTDRPRVGVGVG
jgi:DNA-binding SARP family transcriptional activator